MSRPRESGGHAPPSAVVSSKSAEWFSPATIVVPGRSVLGGYDLDPASCGGANSVVRAASYFTAAEDGKTRPWDVDGRPSRVWCNPPSSQDEGESAAEWWVKFAQEFVDGRMRAGIFVIFNMSTLQVAQLAAHKAGLPPPQWGSRCEPRTRIQYLKGHEPPNMFGEYEPGAAPPHPSALALLTDELDLVLAFREAYAHLGETLPPAAWPVRRPRPFAGAPPDLQARLPMVAP